MKNSALSKVSNLIQGWVAVLSPKKWGVFQEIYQKTKFDAAFTPSWSQGAEDLSIFHLMQSDCDSKKYIDIGAHHPNRFSVTRLLYENGWQGINVDAKPEVANLFKKWRPKDTFIHCAVGDRKEYVFSEYAEYAISTVDPEWKSKFAAQGHQPIKEYTVPGKTLREIFDMVDAGTRVDLITIDIEGADFDALNSLDLKSLPQSRYPRWILLETSPPVKGALETPAVKLAMSFGYEPHLVLPMATLLRASA